MSKPRYSRWLAGAALLPLVGLLGLIARAELALRSAPSFRVAIEGFDPRHLLYGHFLQYRYRFNWQGPSSCGSTEADADSNGLHPGCCLCLTRIDALGIEPPARQISCEEARACDGWLFSEDVAPPLQYFVPEQRAAELERALLVRQASLEVTCVQGRPVVGELHLDGMPWGEALRAP